MVSKIRSNYRNAVDSKIKKRSLSNDASNDPFKGQSLNQLLADLDLGEVPEEQPSSIKKKEGDSNENKMDVKDSKKGSS